MCGIFAYVGRRRSVDDLLVPIFSMRYRGPDSSVVQQVAPHVVFGFHRLAINGLDNASNEPLQLGNCWLVCNGEIYNHVALAERFHFACQTRNDCEVILHLYRHFDGDVGRVVCELDGVFAFVLYDGDRARTVAANDPVGIRPLYYCRASGDDDDGSGSGDLIEDGIGDVEMAFASEPRALASLAAADVRFFPHSCTWTSDEPHVFAPYDVIGVGDGGAASVVAAVPAAPPIVCDWRQQPPVATPFDALDAEQREENVARIGAAIRERLQQAVRKRCMSERPIGCLLSGGIDSSLVAALLNEYLPDGAPLHCFTTAIRRDCGVEAPDVTYARKVAEHLQAARRRRIVHHVVEFGEREFLDAIAPVVRAIQSYDITTVRASVGNYLVAQYIKQQAHCVVVLNGDVSEEQFGSYRYFARAPSAAAFGAEVARLLDEVHAFDVLRSARCMEHFSLEARTPFADRALLRYTMRLPPELKMFVADGNGADVHRYVPGAGFGIEKYLLRRAFADTNLLPADVLWRRKEAFSDGVSARERSWHTIVAEYMQAHVSDADLAAAAQRYAHCTPHTKEALYYRRVYDSALGAKCARLVPHFWLPRFVDCGGDPSARVLADYSGGATADETTTTTTTT